jgi:hypothetical protein
MRSTQASSWAEAEFRDMARQLLILMFGFGCFDRKLI